LVIILTIRTPFSQNKSSTGSQGERLGQDNAWTDQDEHDFLWEEAAAPPRLPSARASSAPQGPSFLLSFPKKVLSCQSC